MFARLLRLAAGSDREKDASGRFPTIKSFHHHVSGKQGITVESHHTRTEQLQAHARNACTREPFLWLTRQKNLTLLMQHASN